MTKAEERASKFLESKGWGPNAKIVGGLLHEAICELMIEFAKEEAGIAFKKGVLWDGLDPFDPYDLEGSYIKYRFND